PFANIVLAKALEGRRTNFHYISETVYHARAVVPKMRVRTRGARGPRILIREVTQPARERIAENFVERGLLVRTGGKILIAVSDHNLVPFADAFCVSVREIGQAIRAEFH